MDQAKKSRGVVKGKITRVQTFLNDAKLNPVPSSTLETKLEMLRDYWKEFEAFQSSIDDLTEEGDMAVQETERVEQEDKYTAIVSGLKDLIVQQQPQTQQNSPAQSMPPSMHHNPNLHFMPKFELPSFNGNFADWPNFRNVFTEMVHKKATLKNFEKLHILKGALVGDAARLLSATDVTDDNYDEAWKSVVKRYDHSRQLLLAQVSILIHLPIVKSESAKDLRKLLETMQASLRAIKSMKIPITEWDPILVAILMDKMDPETRKSYELSLKSAAMPTFSSVEEFVEHHCQALETYESSSKQNGKAAESTKPNAPRSFHNEVNKPQSAQLCLQCKENHPLFKCTAFRALSVGDRISVVKKASACFNCLRQNHNANQCSSGTCRTCGSKHHTMLHIQKERPPPSTFIVTPTVQSQHVSNFGNVLLATAIVRVQDRAGHFQLARALLDSASEASFATESLVQRLGIRKTKSRVQVTGLSQTATGTTNGAAYLRLSSLYNTDFTTSVHTMVLTKVTGKLPSAPFPSQNSEFIHSLSLADPQYGVPGDIDLLLGADCFGEFIRGGTRQGGEGIYALETVFGWVLTGRLQSQTIKVHHVSLGLDEQLRKFWELEEVASQPIRTEEEQKCEEHFRLTHTRTAEGRYIVQLPFREDAPLLGNSREIAERCFYSLEKRLAKNPQLKEDYSQSMEDYIASGHMVPVPSSTPTPIMESTFAAPASSPLFQPGVQHFYMPHHEVVKESSTTTKLRVVFNLSKKSSSGVSLNDRLMVGPKIQKDLLDLLIGFRVHAVALTADIAKMYRQVQVHPSHQSYQLVLWRKRPEDTLQTYVMKVVTFGESSAPFLAQQVLRQLAEDEKRDCPLASEIAAVAFYMDDLMTGVSTEEDVIKVVKEMREMCARGGFDLRKWASNSPAVLRSIPENLRETQLPFTIETDEAVKTLIINWHPATDHFSYKVSLLPLSSVTKRAILSDTARIFDPVGWAAPSIIIAKIILQQLWVLGLGWDEELPPHLADEWKTFRADLMSLQAVKIPRQIADFGQAMQYQLHGFCDSSERAYAAAVYLRSWNLGSGEFKVNLVAAKTRVAPVKQVSLPRLELCGAVLLVRLMSTVISSLNIQIEEIFGWTDSMVVLAWIRALPVKWKTFVANRVTEIQSFSPAMKWAHVKSQDNPADAPSRGVKPSDLASHAMWWTGPAFLRQEPIPMAESRGTLSCKDADKEQRKVMVHHVTLLPSEILERYSSLAKLKRITALLLRFGDNCKSVAEKKTGSISVEDLDRALQVWIKHTQFIHFHDEIEACGKNKEMPIRSKLLPLHPFLDENGVLRVGGRLQAALISQEQMHPIVLPKSGHLTNLLVTYIHLENLHAGPRLLLSSLQQKYWILSGRDVVRKAVHRCTTCTRHRALTAQQLMGNLPAMRLRPQLPFYNTGLDYAGPIALRVSSGRGGKTFKGYICVFVCMATKAIHLECASDLSAEAFIAALRRFVARRANLRVLHSDNGTNFVGANNELKELLQFAVNQTNNDSVIRFLTGRGIDWKFIPPSAPHMGGIWEAGVKSVKSHLRKLIGTQTWTFEEITTILTQIEACLNSRPLTALSSDPGDLSALTPGHFLVLGPMNSVPEPCLNDVNISHMDRWQRIQHCVQQFWYRWRTEYLSSLQPRNKWNKEKKSLQVHDLVLIKDDQQPPCRWKLGRVLELHPGGDGSVRVVTVKTEAGNKQRPVHKLCVLPLCNPPTTIEKSEATK